MKPGRFCQPRRPQVCSAGCGDVPSGQCSVDAQKLPIHPISCFHYLPFFLLCSLSLKNWMIPELLYLGFRVQIIRRKMKGVHFFALRVRKVHWDVRKHFVSFLIIVLVDLSRPCHTRNRCPRRKEPISSCLPPHMRGYAASRRCTFGSR